jgi:hypothetical protein
VLSIFVPFNLSEFRQRKTLGASWRTLVGQHRNFGPSAIDAWFAPDPDPFAFFCRIAARDYDTILQEIQHLAHKNTWQVP